VIQLGRKQGMPQTLTFGDRFGHLIPDQLADFDNRSYSSDDSSFAPSDESSERDDYDYDEDSDDDDDDYDDDDNNSSHDPIHDADMNNTPIHTHSDLANDDGTGKQEIAGVATMPDPECTLSENDDDGASKGSNVPDCLQDDAQEHNAGELHEDVDQEASNDDNELSNNNYNLRLRKPRSYDFQYDHQYLMFDEPFGLLFMTEQMSMKKGLQRFGKKGADAVVAELRQLHYRKSIKPKHKHDLSRDEQRRALRYLMYLKQKRCGRIKARGCADGRKQRIYKTRDETSSPTVSTEAVFLTSMIDAFEHRSVVTLDIPGAFLHADIDEVIHIRLEGVMAELLVRVDPKTYSPFLCVEGGKKVIYLQLNKALYGTLQAALLFWKNLSTFLIDNLGFDLNPYDSCVANKIINRKQCTIIWHVDDLKISHVDPNVIEDIVNRIEEKYGKEDPITVTRGKVHEYLGMTMDF
jgi:hypothetical protein